MKIIFSRKGFDSQYGKVASPIMPDGTILSLPIPSTQGRPLGDCLHGQQLVHQISHDLTGGRIHNRTLVHLDPDLSVGTVQRRPGWRPAFGQDSAAQGHLANQGVGPGDLFLFFGWYRQVEVGRGRHQYIPGAHDIHALFGWLQVGEVIPIDDSGHAVTKSHAWLHDHPHVQHAGALRGKKNTIYSASAQLRLGGAPTGLPGAGVFTRWSDQLRLTAPGRSRSQWRVPNWMYPQPGQPALTYHGNPDRWTRQGPHAYLQTVAKGQEFVLDVTAIPRASACLKKLITGHA